MGPDVDAMGELPRGDSAIATAYDVYVYGETLGGNLARHYPLG